MMSTITGLLSNADGTLANGTAVISWVAFTTHDVVIVGGQKMVAITEGQFTVDLYPNISAFPKGMYYTVRMELDTGSVYEEYWVVPDLPAVSVEQVRSTFPLEPGMAINPNQITGAGAEPGMILAYNGAYWEGSYVHVDNVEPNWIRVESGSSGNDFWIDGSPVSLGRVVTIHIPSASPTARGLVTTGTQSFGGNKTFTGNMAVSGSIAGPTISDIYSQIGSVQAGAVPITRRINSGTGLAGGGDLTADRTLSVVDDTTTQRVEVMTGGSVVGARKRLALSDSTSVVWLGVLQDAATIAVTGVVPADSSNQRVRVSKDGAAPVGTRREINFITGANATLDVSDSPGGNRIDVQIGAIARTVTAGAGLQGGGVLTDNITLTADMLSVNGRTGAVVLGVGDITGAGGVPATRQVIAGAGLGGGGALTADVTLSVVDDTTTQRLRVSNNGTLAGTRQEINFIPGSNVVLSVTNNSGANRMDVTITATPPGAEAAQSPWLVNVDADGHTLYDVSAIGVGTSVVPLAPAVAGRTYLTVKGTSGIGVVELATGEADSAAGAIGQLAWTDPANSQTDKRLGIINVFRAGTTAANRGSTMVFYTRSDNGTAVTERMRIDELGNVGIGTSAIEGRFTVDGGPAFIRSGNYLQLRPLSNLWDMRLQAVAQRLDVISGGLPEAPIASFVHGGNVGIGTTDPQYKLDVAGDINATGSVQVPGNKVLGINLRYDGAWKYIANGTGILVWAGAGQWPQIFSVPEGVAGAVATLTPNLAFSATSINVVGNFQMQGWGIYGVNEFAAKKVFISKYVANALGPELELQQFGGTIGETSRITFIGGSLYRNMILHDLDPATAWGQLHIYCGQHTDPNAMTQVATFNNSYCRFHQQVGIRCKPQNTAVALEIRSQTDGGDALMIAKPDGAHFFVFKPGADVAGSGGGFGYWNGSAWGYVNCYSGFYAPNILTAGTTNSNHFVTASNAAVQSTAGAALEIREPLYANQGGLAQAGDDYAPRIAFHWAFKKIAQIGIDATTNYLRVWDDTTGYSGLVADAIRAKSDLNCETNAGVAGNLSVGATLYTNDLNIAGGCYMKYWYEIRAQGNVQGFRVGAYTAPAGNSLDFVWSGVANFATYTRMMHIDQYGVTFDFTTYVMPQTGNPTLYVGKDTGVNGAVYFQWVRASSVLNVIYAGQPSAYISLQSGGLYFPHLSASPVYRDASGFLKC